MLPLEKNKNISFTTLENYFNRLRGRIIHYNNKVKIGKSRICFYDSRQDLIAESFSLIDRKLFISFLKKLEK